MSDTSKPLPDVHDPVTAPYWAAAKAGRLVTPRCSRCASRLWPPEPVCPSCLGDRFEWEEVEPRGVVWSYAVYHRGLDPAFADELPYAVVLVELPTGAKMYGIFRGDRAELDVGAEVEALFEPATDDVTFVRWRPLDRARSGSR